MIASRLETLVTLTDRAVLPRARWVMTLDRLPPGQQATSSRPNSMPGLRSSSSVASRVAQGNNRHCASRPVNTGSGRRST